MYGLDIGIPFLIVAALLQQGARKFPSLAGTPAGHPRRRRAAGHRRVLQASGTWSAATTWLKVVHWVSGYQPPL